ncbi:unnamed protein product [Parascedosporium putredinis]|uniref:Cell division cycle protein 123 n=1 Tax=Parascedosporium putredinis TaxID=1442378 RepID=A0A9P1M6F9_9PEZI|nr:unnamed protein product [Parascedosporium putredinis]CAI7989622.1 unnamed protein product [Parascedosporium putredinis]
MARLLANVSAASINTRTINRAYAEDLEDEIGPALASSSTRPKGCSCASAPARPRTGCGAPAGPSPSTATRTSSCNSQPRRAWITVTNYLNKNPQSPLPLFFLPFDSRIKTEMEYRVFCAPESLRVCAVSQYEWHKPWRFSTRSETGMQTAAGTILEGIDQIRAQIVAELKAPGTDEADDLLRRQGMTFDVWYDDEAGKVKLVELNTYGVRSACGSCLFHWVNDRETMYDASEVEFRVVVDQDHSPVQSQNWE